MTARYYRIGKDPTSWGDREVFRETLLADGTIVRIMNPSVYHRAVRAARLALRQAEPFRLIEADERAEAAEPLRVAERAPVEPAPEVEPLRMAARPTAEEPPPAEAAEPAAAAEPSPAAAPPADPLRTAEPLRTTDELEPASAEHREESNRGGHSESRL